MKRLNLQRKEKEMTVFDTGLPLHFSGFCFTDNQNFAEFHLSNKFPKLNVQYTRFPFEEKDLVYELGTPISFTDNGKFWELGSFFIDKLFVMYFNKRYKEVELKYNRLHSFLGVLTENIIGVVNGEKLVGVLMLKTKRKETNHG